MSFFDVDPDIIKYPPSETHILNVEIKPYEDNHRIQVSLEFSPFSERPIIELLILDRNGLEVGSTTIVEPPYWKQKLTMHIKTPNPNGTFTLKVKLLFLDFEIQEEKTIDFAI